MSLITIVQEAARHCGLDVPDVAIGSTDRAVQNLVDFSADAARECARRAEWRALTNAFIIDTTVRISTLPEDFDRLITGASVVLSTGIPLRGSMSYSEWSRLPDATGTPRYFMRNNYSLHLWPVTVASATATVLYLTNKWALSEGATPTYSSAWVADTDLTVFPEPLIVMGTIWRMKQQLGQDYADQIAQFEAMLADYNMQDQAPR